MKRTPFKKKLIKPLKRTPVKRSKLTSKRVKLPKRELMPNRVKRAKKELTELSHTFVRKRDSVDKNKIGGYCISCKKYCSGADFQSGHWIPDSIGGALLRWHPLNMSGQGGYCCNINRHGQQRMGNDYTLALLEKHGLERINELRRLCQKSIKCDILFLEKMIELYKGGNEAEIVGYIHSLV